MASIDEIWKEMNRSDPSAASSRAGRSTTKKKVNNSSKKTSVSDSTFRSLLSNPTTCSSRKNVAAASIKEMSGSYTEKEASTNLVQLQRDLQALETDESLSIRKKALISICQCLFPNNQKNADIPLEKYEEVMEHHFKAFFKRLADPSEACRERAVHLIEYFFTLILTDLTPYLAYFFPAFMARMQMGLIYDAELQLFVADVEEHEAYKRGKATHRQDKRSLDTAAAAAGSGGHHHKVVDPSEEIRLLLCHLLHKLIQIVLAKGAGQVLHSYFHDVILFLQNQLQDPFPDLRIEACAVLTLMAESPVYELGIKLYAIGLTRAILPLLKHRLAKVRIAAIDAITKIVQVPNRDKRKGAGTEAIIDLVGFRDDNVIPVGAFYRPEVSINHLAEIVQDSNSLVREHTALMLATWLIHLPDRYDYESRLLPYLLNFINDPIEKIQQIALGAISKCGEMYEMEHDDDIIERRQYGVDGDDRCNHSKPLPPPFVERPRLGTRLYVRGSTKRILHALLNELSNWMCKTRVQSALLLRVVLIFCEEHLVSDLPIILSSLYKALHLARQEKDAQLHLILLECAELLGRFALPETYLALISPRLKGDAIDRGGTLGGDEAHKADIIALLGAMVQGSRPREVVKHMTILIDVMTDEEVYSQVYWFASSQALLALLKTLLYEGSQGGQGMVEAHFLSTGRLESLHVTLYQAYRYLLISLVGPWGIQSPCSTSSAAALILPSSTAAASIVSSEQQQGENLRKVAEEGLEILSSLYSACRHGRMEEAFASKLIRDMTPAFREHPTWLSQGEVSGGTKMDGRVCLCLSYILVWEESIIQAHLHQILPMLCAAIKEMHTSRGTSTNNPSALAKLVMEFLIQCLDKVVAAERGAAEEEAGVDDGLNAVLACHQELLTFCLKGKERSDWLPPHKLKLLKRLCMPAIYRRSASFGNDNDDNEGLMELITFLRSTLSDPSSHAIRQSSLQVITLLLQASSSSPDAHLMMKTVPDLRTMCDSNLSPPSNPVAKLLCQPVMDGLVDASPIVAMEACETLHQLLYFTTTVEKHGVLYYPQYVHAILDPYLELEVEADNGREEEGGDETYSASLRDHLDGLLRMAAVRHPPLFLELLKKAQKSRGGLHQQVLSELIDHAEMLQVLQIKVEL